MLFRSLECSLIKRHQPKYNIQLKDSKGYYPFIRLSDEPYPSFSVAYNTDDPAARHFGPYGRRNICYSVINAVNNAIGLPTCGKSFPKEIGKERPCLHNHTKSCVGVCTGNVSPEEYQKLIRQAVLMLEGKHKNLCDELTAQMEEAAAELLFEKAAYLRDRLRAISALGKRQLVVGGAMADLDALACFTGETRSGIAVLHYMDGDLIGRDVEIFNEPADEKEALGTFLPQYYLARKRCPDIICVSHELEDSGLLESLFEDSIGKKTKITAPKRGDKLKLVELAVSNAREEVERVTTREEKQKRLLTELQRLLALPAPPMRIEAVDISNTGNSDCVGLVTCFVNARPLKKAYRQYLIKRQNGQDDYHAMQEVLERRLKRLDEESPGFEDPPDLLLVDGGAAHASMAQKLLAGRGIPVFGMVKDDRHRTRGLMTPGGDEVSIQATPALFAFVGQIQEETHRSALAFHKKRRSTFITELEHIPGIGEARRNLLIASYKSLQAISQASPEELEKILPADAARNVYEYFRAAR